MSVVFRFDLNACTGCAACRLACTIENELPWGTSWRKVSTYNDAGRPGAPRFHLSHACYHCADAPCLPACPARAIARDEPTGAVLIDAARCLGCGYCGWVCPFDAPVLDEAAGVMTKCTFCRDRLVAGLAPACVTQCPTGALQSARAEDGAGEERVEGFPSQAVGPAARFVPLRRGNAGPVTHLADETPPSPRPIPSAPSHLRDAWPLLVFTLAAAGLVGWWSGALLGGPAVRPLWFLGGGVAAMGVGAAHLGRPARAWRALLGFRSSWLSREVVLFHAFLGLAAARFGVSGVGAEALAWSAAAAGLAALFAADRIYDPLLARRPLPLHSADTLLTALLFATVLAARPWLVAPLLAVTGVLYARRGRGSPARGVPRGRVRASARIAVGLVAPFLLLLGGESVSALACLAAGAALDRVEFYLELTPSSPARRMERDLAARFTRREGGVSDPAV